MSIIHIRSKKKKLVEGFIPSPGHILAVGIAQDEVLNYPIQKKDYPVSVSTMANLD